MKIIKFLALLITPLIVAYFVMDWTEANSDDGKTARVVVMVVWFVLWGYLGFWIIRGAWRSLKGWWNKPSKKSLDEEIAEIDRQTEKQIEKSKTNLENLFLQELDDIEFRYLDLESLALLSLQSIVRKIELIKTRSDPLLRLAVAYLFIEQLSDSFKPESSSVGLFTYKFFKQELSDEDFSKNFEEGENSPDFKSPVWHEGTQEAIESAYKKCPDIETKSNICADFCADLVSEIEDEGLKERFSALARETLEENNVMTKSAESSLTTIEF